MDTIPKEFSLKTWYNFIEVHAANDVDHYFYWHWIILMRLSLLAYVDFFYVPSGILRQRPLMFYLDKT